MKPLALRKYQSEAIARFRALPEPRRLFLAWDMGAGKTLGALAIAKAYDRQKILIVCPAIVRETWRRVAEEYLDSLTVGVIDVGLTRTLSKAKRCEQEMAREAQVQIISYDLLRTLEVQKEDNPDSFDFIIIDEFHALRSVTSKQSQSVRTLFRLHPKAWAVGLSGTPIPNEAKQLWNPVDTFFPGLWGKQTRPGFEPWAFVSRYCHAESNGYGTSFTGLKENRREELEAKFQKVSQRVVQADFAKYLPPLFVEQLPVKKWKSAVDLALEWQAMAKEETAHIGIYTHLRGTAQQIASKMPGAFLITGETAAAARDEILAKCRESERSVIIATTHSLQQGISLSFQKAALIAEFTSEVSNVAQFCGRFARQDSASLAPTRVQIAVGPNDVSKAETLTRRIADINAVIKKSKAMEGIENVFETEQSDDDFHAELNELAALAAVKANLWSAQEDDDALESDT